MTYIVDKFTKLSKIGVSLEFFTADFFQYFSAAIEIWILGGYQFGWRFAINFQLFWVFLENS